MSATVAKALHFTFGDGAEQTACFVEKVNKFFDCFNVSTFTQGKFFRKVFQMPYRRADDFRMKVGHMHNSYKILRDINLIDTISTVNSILRIMCAVVNFKG